MKITGSRTFLQVRVGRNAICEVVLNIRQVDLAWINGRQQQTTTTTDEESSSKGCSSSSSSVVLQEFFDVLQTSIFPRIMADEIEDANYYGKKPPSLLGPGGIPIHVAEKNTQQQQQKRKRQTAASKKKGKKGAAAAAASAASTAAAAAVGTKRKRGAGKNKLEAQSVNIGDDADGAKTMERDVFYAFGQSIQVAYRWEEVHAEKHSTVTLVFCDNDNNNDSSDESGSTSSKKKASASENSTNNNKHNMRQLEPLSKRILAWVYPFDPDNPSEPDPPGGGFPLPERIPIASLFRDRGGAPS